MAPHLATDVLPDAKDAGALAVLDPMCGSGTVLRAGVEKGHKALGFDLDPLAVLMARVASTPVDVGAVEEAASSLVISKEYDPAGFFDEETAKFANYWFGAHQQAQLAGLSQAIRQLSETAVKEVLQVALSRIIVTKSPKASLAADTSHSRPHRVATESEYDVVRGFHDSLRSLNRILLSRQIARGQSIVQRGDARELTAVPDSSIDVTITSPPYLNAIDYLRGHKMSLIWLGYSIADIRAIRSSSIGAEKAPSGPIDAQADSLVAEISSHVEDPDLLPVPILRRYAGDLCRHSVELHRVGRTGSKVVSVVGNSTLRGNFIRNDLITSRALELAGFHVTSRFEREIPPTSRYLPISQSADASSLSKRMRTEVVIMAEKG
jgi:hypothetical protein